MILMNIGVIVGLIIQALPFNLYEQYIGKLIQGTCAGTFCVLTPVFINDISPVEFLGPLGGINQFMVTVGIMIPPVMAIPIPAGIVENSEAEDPSYKDDYLVSGYWRLIILAPAAFAVFAIIM